MKFWRGRSKRVPAEQRQAGPADEAPTIDLLARADVTRETFFLLYARLIEEELGAVNLRFIEDGVLTFEAPSGKTKTTFMENAWLQCKSANEPRVEIIQRYLRTLRAIDEEPDCSREQIIAIVKDSEYVSSLGKDTPLKHLAADLWIVYALDLPESTRSLSAEQMTQLGLQEGDLPSLAEENLKRILPDIECHGSGPWFMLTAGGDYVASILLLDGVWDQLAATVGGDIVVTVPARDVLFFTGSASQEGLATIRKKADEIVSSGDHVVSRTLLRRVEGQWVNFD